MQRGAFTLIELIVVVAILLVMAAVFYPVTTRCGPGNTPRSSCQSNLKQIGLAFVMYAQDFEERYPPATLNPKSRAARNPKYRYGWADTLMTYTKDNSVFQCPSEPTRRSIPRQPWLAGYTDYFLNTQMSAIPIAKISDPNIVVLMGEGNDGRDQADARYAFPSMPITFGLTDTSPARRHLNGANYGFADGHVKWMHYTRQPSLPVPGVSGFRFGK